jgi:putative addiction module component (TIGR02574 family)
VTAKAEKIVAEALALPASVRAFVAEKLIESLDVAAPAELPPAWKEELRKRCREIDQNSVQLLEADAVFSKAFKALA